MTNLTKEKMMIDKPQPRAKYGFEKMKVNDVMKVKVPDNDREAGERARTAAYAYGCRNGWKFCGAHEEVRGKLTMLIRRVK